jgi:hypothetical protein
MRGEPRTKDVDMAVGRYRSVFHTDLPADEAFPVAEQQIRCWLGHKNLDQQAFDKGSARVGPAGQLMLVLARNAPDGTQTKRWQLREPRGQGTWVSTLTIHAPGVARDQVHSWFWLDIEFLGSSADEEEDNSRRRPRPGVPGSPAVCWTSSTPVIHWLCCARSRSWCGHRTSTR